MKNRFIFSGKLNMAENSLILMLLGVMTLFVAMPANTVAQYEYAKRVYGQKIEEKADKSTFIIADQRNLYYTFNKNNTLMLKDSHYQNMVELAGYSPRTFNNRDKLDSLVLKMIAPHFRSYKANDKYLIVFSVDLYSGLDGNVCEIAFVYPKDANLPLKVLEHFEKEVLNSGFKIIFDKNNKFFEGSTWVNITYHYSVFWMQQKLKETDK